MSKAGYDKAFATATVSVTSGLAIVIPPSIAFIVYGGVADVSVPALFAAGFLPGVLVALFIMGAVLLISRKHGYKGKGRQMPVSKALRESFWGIMTPVVILGGIYGGVFTPTEAAAVAIFYGLFVGVFIYRTINSFAILLEILTETVKATSVVMIVVTCAGLFSWVGSTVGLVEKCSCVLLGVSHNQWVVLFMAAQILEERALKTRQFFNAIAEDWDELNREVLGAFDLPEAVCAAVPEGCGMAVDLGCGTGGVLARLLPRAHGVIGVDGSARMLEICRRRFTPEDIADGRVSLRIGELSHLPLRDHEANFACINLVLHHLSDPAEGLREIRRIMPPGGRLFVADFLRHADETMRNRYGDRWLGFDETQLTADLATAGFAVLHCDRKPVDRNMTLLLLSAEAR